MRCWLSGFVLLISGCCFAQIDRIVIPAGTPEDQDLTAISNEQDAQKKLALYQQFVDKYRSNPAAVAYGNWQIAQAYQARGELPKALEYGDKALAASPHNLDILVSQTNLAQTAKDNSKIIEYATRGGQAYNGIDKQVKPENMNEQEFANAVQQEKDAAKGSYEFLEAAAFNAIADEKNAKARMSSIERFNQAFPQTRFAVQIAQYAMYTLGPGQLNDPTRLKEYGEKTLANDPTSIPTLLLLANAYVEDAKPTSVARAAAYAEKVISLSKADNGDAKRSQNLSAAAGVAHSTLGYALAKQEKYASAVPHLKTAAELLKGQDEVAYAAALFRLGFVYAKLNRGSEARETLTEAAKIPGPVQKPAQDLLAKLSAAKKTR